MRGIPVIHGFDDVSDQNILEGFCPADLKGRESGGRAFAGADGIRGHAVIDHAFDVDGSLNAEDNGFFRIGRTFQPDFSGQLLDAVMRFVLVSALRGGRGRAGGVFLPGSLGSGRHGQEESQQKG